MHNLWIWLVVKQTTLKHMSASIGMMTFPMYGKRKVMFQTTNQTWTDVFSIEFQCSQGINQAFLIGRFLQEFFNYEMVGKL